MAQFSFRPAPIRPWNGRYARIPGETTVFHAKSVDGVPTVVLDWDTEGERRTCHALNGPDVRLLVARVMQAKREMGGRQGGSFQINEFGQVLVPASDGGGRRRYVGDTRGSLRFEDPSSGRRFTLADCVDLSAGDPWPLPYVGMPFHLHGRRGKGIYHWSEDDVSGGSEYPPRTNHELVRALRDLRPYGAVRFLVNPERIVLTKRQPKGGVHSSDDADWEPIFVGHLDLNQWFPKET